MIITNELKLVNLNSSNSISGNNKTNIGRVIARIPTNIIFLLFTIVGKLSTFDACGSPGLPIIYHSEIFVSKIS